MGLLRAGGTLVSMGSALAMTTAEQGTVLLLVAALAAPIAAAMFAGSGKAWRSIGKGPFAIEPETARESGGASADTARERAVRAVEVRQMLAAKAERRRRRGEPPLDVEAETRRLLGPAAGGRD